MSCHSYCQYCAARDAENADLQARLAECERGNEQAERNYERARDSVLEEEWKRRAKEKEAELAALREALEAVDAWDIRWADGLDSNVERIKKIVRDALGRRRASPSALAQNSHPVANMSADSEAPTE